MAASHHSAITDDTLVVTTVHDCQVFDQLPADIFESHDLSVDVIVTPTEVFRVSERLKKPEGIQWSLLSRDKFDQIPILKEIQYKEMKNGKDTRLRGETHQQNFNGGNNHHHSKKETWVLFLKTIIYAHYNLLFEACLQFVATITSATYLGTIIS